MATGRKLFVTFNYAGYPMVREARGIIAAGSLGRVQQIYCEMPQESFSRTEANPQDWRKRDYEILCFLRSHVHVHQMTHYLFGGDKCDEFTAWEASWADTGCYRYRDAHWKYSISNSGQYDVG